MVILDYIGDVGQRHYHRAQANIKETFQQKISITKSQYIVFFVFS